MRIETAIGVLMRQWNRVGLAALRIALRAGWIDHAGYCRGVRRLFRLYVAVMMCVLPDLRARRTDR
jgi:hypothetical protein